MIKETRLRDGLCLWKHGNNTIDLDLQSDMRDEVIKTIREEYGEDKVLQLATYTTEGVSSSILTSCNGLGIDNIVARNISNLANSDDSLRDQVLGNTEKGIKPNSKLVTAINDHSGLKESVLELEGLISGRGSHAGGIVVFNNGYIKEGNALMKTTSGTDITQFDGDDTGFLGGMKIDLLSTDALTRLRTAFDLLLEHNEIEWQGTLRETYNKYLHPDVLDYDSEGMYDMLFNGDVISAFQFSTDVGDQALRKVNARNFKDLSAANALMRLTTKHDEQPIDKYVRFRDDIDQWYDEMVEFGLTTDEIEVIEKHLIDKSGICDTQEALMQLAMDKNVANYTLQEANMFRKMVAKANKQELDLEYGRLIDHATKAGNRVKLIDYIYNYCFKPQFGYAFSDPHIVGYTLITMQQMNLCYKYTPLYWQTACLIVDSGGNDGDDGNDYGRISRAANSLHGKVRPPYINSSGLTFTPIPEEDSILFGLKPISGLRKDTLSEILDKRPFESIEDFMDKTDATVNQVQTLIKSGAFNNLYDMNPRDIMIKFVDEVAVKGRDRLTMANFRQVYETGIIDKEEYEPYYLLYMFREAARKGSGKNEFFKEYFFDKLSFIDHEYDEDGNVLPDLKQLEKYYDKEMDTIRGLLSEDYVIDGFNRQLKNEHWLEKCSGSIESWQMETISFYPDKHEFDYIPVHKYFPVSNFNNMTERGVLAGTVIDKDKNKSLIYLSTKEAVVTVKMWRNMYNKYDEVYTNGKSGKDRVLYDDSWFKRGSKLIIVGRKSGEQFFIDSRRTRYKPVYLIEGFNDEQIMIREERRDS